VDLVTATKGPTATKAAKDAIARFQREIARKERAEKTILTAVIKRARRDEISLDAAAIRIVDELPIPIGERADRLLVTRAVIERYRVNAVAQFTEGLLNPGPRRSMDILCRDVRRHVRSVVLGFEEEYVTEKRRVSDGDWEALLFTLRDDIDTWLMAWRAKQRRR
jgi:hypothetical protein